MAKVIRTFETTGRTTPIGPMVDREREKYGLGPLGPVPMDEIRVLIEPSEPSQASSSRRRGRQRRGRTEASGSRSSRAA